MYERIKKIISYVNNFLEDLAIVLIILATLFFGGWLRGLKSTVILFLASVAGYAVYLLIRDWIQNGAIVQAALAILIILLAVLILLYRFRMAINFKAPGPLVMVAKEIIATQVYEVRPLEKRLQMLRQLVLIQPELAEQLSKEIHDTPMDEFFVRILNANFAEPEDSEHTLPLNRSLGADLEYDLRVDIGLLWLENPSLFYKDKKAIFPETAAQGLLSEEDKEEGAFDVDVVFASDYFQPQVVTGKIRLQIGSLERSRPYVDGELADEPGWLSLRVRTTSFPSDTEKDSIVPAYGRLGLYYKNNVLQSAVIRVGVSREAGMPLLEENSGEIDYVLSYDFNDVDDSLAIRELTFGDDPTATKEYPIALNITLNSNGNDTHHFLVNSYNDDENLDYPATYHQFSEGALSDTLTRIRAALRESTESTTSNKDRAQFIEEIKLLAYYGSILKSIFYSASEPETEDHRSVVVPKWQSDLKRLLERRRVIQVARTKNADYAFPWAMVYDYDMDRPPGEKDGKKEEYKIEYKYCKSLLNWPQDTIWKNAQAEDRCPYHDKIDHSYGENNRNFLCLYGFWGLKHIIEQPMQKYSPPENDSGNKIGNILKVTKVNKKISLGIAVTDELKEESLAKRKIHLKNLGQSKTINVTPINPARTTSAALQLLHQPDLIYFLCHGKLDKDKKGKIITPLISIGSGQSPDYWIYPAFDRYLGSFNIDHWLQNRPIIFINGCHTADLEPFIPLSFVKSFGDYGANAVIGTEIPVAPGPAMDVAELILLEIANCRMSIGDIVRNMRWEMAKKGSLIGLAYTPYCLADLHTQFKE
jgi:hypothetical protein